MSDPIVEHVISAILTGTAGFLSAGTKFVSDLKGLEDKIVKRMVETYIEPMLRRIDSVENRVIQSEKQQLANTQGWNLELNSIRGDIDDIMRNRGHGHSSAIDYHSSEEVVRRIEQLETDARRALQEMKRVNETLEDLEKYKTDRKLFDNFVADQNKAALDLTRALGAIEGELRAQRRGKSDER